FLLAIGYLIIALGVNGVDAGTKVSMMYDCIVINKERFIYERYIFKKSDFSQGFAIVLFYSCTNIFNLLSGF
ncbi:MAG: hypothetical protein R3Y33_03430, partial [Clostridia bacterium]